MSFTEADYQTFLARGLVARAPQAPRGTPVIPLAQEPEHALQARVRRLALESGWLCYHTHDARRSAPGFPDLVLCRPGGLLFTELKTTTGKLTREQAVWLDVLGRSVPGVEAHLWRPGDWEIIYARLTRPQGGGNV